MLMLMLTLMLELFKNLLYNSNDAILLRITSTFASHEKVHLLNIEGSNSIKIDVLQNLSFHLFDHLDL